MPEDFGIVSGGEDVALLENQPVPITAVDYVAHMAGFSSASHLGSALRAATGMSPAQWHSFG